MLFRQLNIGACRTYLIASERTHEAVLVDPVLERAQDYLDALAREGLTIRYAINTHTHADHIAGTAFIGDRTDALVVMQRSAPSGCVSLRIDEARVLDLGDLQLELRHTPGHTPDSMCILLPDRVLTGDTLFIGGAGRTDLPGGDPGQHYDSLFNIIASLPETLLIFPAHDYNQKYSSDLGTELKTNPWLQPRSKADYIAWLAGQAQPTPEWMLGVLQANYACAQDPRQAWIPIDAPACQLPVAVQGGGANQESMPTMPPEALHETLQAVQRGRPLVLDVREADEYTGPLGHIDGSLLLPVAQLAERLAELAAYQKTPIVTVCRSGKRSATAASILAQAGFDDVISLEGGMIAWNERGYTVRH